MAIPIPSNEEVRAGLDQRSEACYRAAGEGDHMIMEVHSFLRYCHTNLATKAVLTHLEQLLEARKLSVEGRIVSDNFDYLDLPEDEEERVALYLLLLTNLGKEHKTYDAIQLIDRGRHTSFEDMNEYFLERVLDPLCEYILGEIRTANRFLYLLCRYKRNCEWFARDELRQAFQSNSARGEAVLNTAFRRWLFDQGIDYPFSEPSSPHGQADVVLPSGDSAIPIEVKVYDGKDRDVAHVKQGLH